jgi:ATP-dependent Clp protease ATP-binding subunit ClpA
MSIYTMSVDVPPAKGASMPSSKDRQRVEIPTNLYERLKLLADSEDRTLTSLLQDLLRLGLANYQPLWMPSRFMNRFTEGARRTLALAKEEAQSLHHNYIGTEHLLLGLLREGDGIAAQVLHQLWVDADQVRRALVYILTQHAPNQPTAAPSGSGGKKEAAQATAEMSEAERTPSSSPGESGKSGDVGLTPRARTVLALAVDEAQRLHQDFVGTEHLLLALAREGDGLAAGILRTFGALGKVREFTLARLQDHESEPPDGQDRL